MVIINLVLQLCYCIEMLFYIILSLCSICAGITSAIASYICHKILSLVYVIMCISVSLFTFKSVDNSVPRRSKRKVSNNKETKYCSLQPSVQRQINTQKYYREQVMNSILFVGCQEYVQLTSAVVLSMFSNIRA